MLTSLLHLLLLFLPVLSADHSPDHSLDLLDAALIEVIRVDNPKLFSSQESLLLTDAISGEQYAVSKLQLEVAAEKALLEVQKIASEQHHHGFSFNPLKWPKAVKDLIQALPENIVIIDGHLRQMIKETGIVPVAGIVAVAAATYIPYTIATEAIEWLVLGPAHVACMTFQIVYIRALASLAIPARMGQYYYQSIMHGQRLGSRWMRSWYFAKNQSIQTAAWKKLLERDLHQHMSLIRKLFKRSGPSTQIIEQSNRELVGLELIQQALSQTLTISFRAKELDRNQYLQLRRELGDAGRKLKELKVLRTQGHVDMSSWQDLHGSFSDIIRKTRGKSCHFLSSL